MTRELACVVIAALGVACGVLAPCPSLPATPVAPHVVTPDHCALVELELDGGLTSAICLSASQLEKVLAP